MRKQRLRELISGQSRFTRQEVKNPTCKSIPSVSKLTSLLLCFSFHFTTLQMASHEEPGESISKANIADLRWLLCFMKGSGPHKANVSGLETWEMNIICLGRLSVGKMKELQHFSTASSLKAHEGYFSLSSIQQLVFIHYQRHLD